MDAILGYDAEEVLRVRAWSDATHTQQHTYTATGVLCRVSGSMLIVMTYSIYRWWVRIQTSISREHELLMIERMLVDGW